MAQHLTSCLISPRPWRALSFGLLAFWGWHAPPISAQPAPNWQAVTATERGQFYIDPASVRRSDGVVRLKTLLDYKLSQTTHNGKAFRSAVSLMEIDCKSDMGRIVEMSYHAAPMMGGPRVETQGMVQDWQDISPESPVRRIASRVCK
ncbi:MAG: hypothetical protein RL657_34 [Pseudomonadota bacterium]|jgi:hypothetical protein